MTFRLPFLKALIRNTGATVFALDYRGYGHSAGSPSERGIQADARSALNHVYQRKDVDTSHIFAFGRSLGGAVALHLAAGDAEKRIHGLVIENAFASVEEMVPQVSVGLHMCADLTY